MEEFNTYGWSGLHEACYKGYINAVARYIEHTRKSTKNNLEQRTIDDYKATPLLMAALGGHIDLVELLIKNGVDITTKLDYRSVKHGLIEIAIIREDLALLCLVFDKFPDSTKRIMTLMGLERLDIESRASVGRCIQRLSLEYNLKNSKTNESTSPNQQKQINDQQSISQLILNEEEFGASLSKYLKVSERNEECLTSGLLTLVNVSCIERVRKSFLSNNGINLLISHLDRERKELTSKLDSLRRQLKEDAEFGPPVVHMEDLIRTESTLIGQCLSVLTAYDDCLDLINSEGLNDHLIAYIKIMFDLYSFVNPATAESDSFEQFIGAYLTCLTHLIRSSRFNKKYFLNLGLLEPILKFWAYINHQYEYNSTAAAPTSTNHYRQRNAEMSIVAGLLNKLRKESMTRELNHSKYSTRNYNLSFQLIKTLMLVLIECLGNVIHDNDDLKKRFIYSYNPEFLSQQVDTTENNSSDNQSLAFETNSFIRTITWRLCDQDRDVQLQILKFVRLIAENDHEIQQRLVPTSKIESSLLIANLRILMRKNCPLNIRVLSLFVLWTLSGGVKFGANFDRKCLMFRSIEAEKYIDMLTDVSISCEDVILRSLEALEVLASSPPYQKLKADSKTYEIVLEQDEIAKVHTVHEVIRLLSSKTLTSPLIFAGLRVISAMCVGACYTANKTNQSSVEKISGIPVLIDLLKRAQTHSAQQHRLKSEIYYCLSMVCLNNARNRKVVGKHLTRAGLSYDTLIKDLVNLMSIGEVSIVLNKNEALTWEEIEVIETRIQTGLTVCAFSYKNELFLERLITLCGRIKWSHLAQLFSHLNHKLTTCYQFKDVESLEFCFKMRCLYGYQIAALFYLIIQIEPRQDPRAIGIKLLVDIIRARDTSAYLKSIACDYTGRLAKYNEALIESLLCVNVIEALSESASKSASVGQAERANAAMSLGVFTGVSVEARRIVARLARTMNGLMENLLVFNKVLHVELMRQWGHFRELNDKRDVLNVV